MMKKMFQKSVAVALSCAMLLSSASALTAEEVLTLLDAYYLDEVPAASREMETAEEILASLGDPYTVYMPATDYVEFLESVDGESLVGMGVMIHQVQDKGVEIISVLPDSPALDAGLVSGDVIVSVDGVELVSADHAQELIAGAEGTDLTVVILHADGTTDTYKMTRRLVEIPIVTYEMVDGVMYITCDSFGDSTADTVRAALEENIFSDTPFIMDLQNNPGGTDTAAAGTAGWFLGGATICYYLNSSGNVSRLYTYENTPDFTDQPLIIITSSHSASGAEMFAAAIRDYQGGIAIGDRTYGKGIAQVMLDESSFPEMFDGDSVKITTARFYAAGGGTNDTVGVIPTLTIDSQYVAQVALLLSAAEPEDMEGFLKLELGGSTLYVDIEKAMSEDYLPAFQELLESIAITQYIYLAVDGEWVSSAGFAVADYLGVDYVSREYTDASSSSYINQLSSLAVSDILPVNEDGSLGVSETMTRGEFAYLLAYALQLRVVEGNPFADVAGDDENLEAIAALYAKSLIQGDEFGNFNPDDAITHQEAVVMLSNTAKWLSLDALSAYYENVDGLDEVDMDKYAGYASWAQQSAIILDAIDGLVKDTTPDTVRKDEAAAMIYGLLSGCNLLWE